MPVQALSRRDILRLTPTILERNHTAIVVAFFHHLLPSISINFLRNYLQSGGVQTLLLLMPDELVPPGDDENHEGYDPGVDSGVHGDTTSEDTVPEGAEDEGEESPEEEDVIEALMPAGEAAQQGLGCRLVGAVSYEFGEKLGHGVMQVSLLGVQLRYQRLGVASRLLRTLLCGEGSCKRPDVALTWADAGAVSFFRRHGFVDDPLMNARWREVSVPWARSTLMSAQLTPPMPDISGSVSSTSALENWSAASGIVEKLEAWRRSRLLEYSRELGLVEHLQAEIRMLRQKVC